MEFLALGMELNFLQLFKKTKLTIVLGRLLAPNEWKGEGYYGNILVEFRGGLGQEAVLLTLRLDLDEVENVQFPC